VTDPNPVQQADLEWAVRRTPRHAGEDVCAWLERVLHAAGVRLAGPAVKPWPELGAQERAEILAARNEPA
jgi:hypothetical protein